MPPAGNFLLDAAVNSHGRDVFGKVAKTARRRAWIGTFRDSRVLVSPPEVDHSRPAARSVRIANGILPADILLGQSAAAEMDAGNRKSHHDLAGEEHDHDDFDTFALDIAASDRAALETRVRAAMAIDGVLRIKGLVKLDGKPAPLAVQAVGPRVETWFVADAARKPGLVVIGLKGLDRSRIERALGAARPSPLEGEGGRGATG